MSVHRDCGADIVWMRRDDDSERFLPPMEYAGEVYVKDDDGCAKRVHGYRMHMCDPDAIIAWQDYQRRLAEAKGEEYTPYEAARERESESMWELVLPIECSRCEASVGEKCHSLAVHLRKTGVVEETRNPHPQRIQDALAAKDNR